MSEVTALLYIQAEAQQLKNMLRCGHIAGKRNDRCSVNMFDCRHCCISNNEDTHTCIEPRNLEPVGTLCAGSTCCNAYNTGILVLRNRPATLELMAAWYQRLAQPDDKEACV